MSSVLHSHFFKNIRKTSLAGTLMYTCSCICILLLQCTIHAHAAANPPGMSRSALSVNASVPWFNSEGYTPVILQIKSKDACELRVWISGNDCSAHKIFRIPAGRSITKTILLPSPTDLYTVKIRWQSDTGQKGTRNTSIHMQHRETHAFIVERDRSISDNDIFDKLPSGPYSGDTYKDLQIESLPQLWQGYPLWAYLILTPQAEEKISDEQIQAIQKWHLCGGRFSVSTASLQEIWQKRGIAAPLLYDDGALALQTHTQRIANNRRDGQQHKVPGTESAPTNVYIVVLIIFIILVGPVNYIWVRRRKQLYLFLISTPLLSSVFCVCLFLTGILSEGFGSHRSVVELTWLDMEHHQAVTWHSISWFSGLSPGGFSLAADSLVHMSENDDRSYGYRSHDDDSRGSLDLNWVHGQKATGDWLPSRSHQQIEICTPHAEQRRIFVYANAAGDLVVHNGFDKDIRYFVWRNAKNELLSARGIASGQQQVLTHGTDHSTGKPKRTSGNMLATNAEKQFRRFTSDVDIYWEQKNEHFFHAVLDHSLHAIPGPPALDAEKPVILLCGYITPGVAP